MIHGPEPVVSGVESADVVEEDGGAALDPRGREDGDAVVVVLPHGEARVPHAVVVHQRRQLVDALEKIFDFFKISSGDNLSWLLWISCSKWETDKE